MDVLAWMTGVQQLPMLPKPEIKMLFIDSAIQSQIIYDYISV
jgi:hypothetical protein